MLFVSLEDFYAQTEKMRRLTREEETECALAMAQGDAEARQRLICSYLPFVAARIRQAPPEIQTLRTVYSAIATLEKGVDTFRFQQSNETFYHHLSWRLRQCLTRCIAQR